MIEPVARNTERKILQSALTVFFKYLIADKRSLAMAGKLEATEIICRNEVSVCEDASLKRICLTNELWREHISEHQIDLSIIRRHTPVLVSRDLSLGYKQTYTHNADGEVIESRLYKNDDLVELFKHEYGNSSLVTYGYNSKNQLVTTVKNEFSQDGKIVKHTEIVDSISKDYGFVSTYSYSGNTETIVDTNLKDGSLNQKHEYEYDSHGNIVKEIYFNYSLQKGYTYENTYEYDAQGRLVSKVCDRDYELVHVNYTYNDDGTIRNEHYINKGEKLFEEYDLEYTYKYKKK